MSNVYGVNEDAAYDIYFKENAAWFWFKKILALCIEEGKPGHFLDVGAGLGYFVECCGKFGIKCTGVEGSEFAVRKAKERNVSLVNVTLGESPLPFASETFATILMSEFIEHVPNRSANKILEECYRVLEKDGVLIILSPSKYNPKVNKDPDHINLYTRSGIKKEIESAGFAFQKYVQDSPRTFLFHNKVEYFLMRQLYKFIKADFLSQSAACIGVKK